MVDQKNLFSTWNIDTACYYWKHLKKVFSVITGCVNISCREQVFLAHQRFRRLTTSWIFDFWRKTAYWKYLVPWMLKSPLTSVLDNIYPTFGSFGSTFYVCTYCRTGIHTVRIIHIFRVHPFKYSKWSYQGGGGGGADLGPPGIDHLLCTLKSADMNSKLLDNFSYDPIYLSPSKVFFWNSSKTF